MTAKPNPMKAAVLGMTEPEQPQIPAKKPATSIKQPKAKEKPAAVPPSRDNKRHIGGFFDPLVAKQLKIMAAEHDRSIQALLQEALNDLFNKHGKSSVA